MVQTVFQKMQAGKHKKKNARKQAASTHPTFVNVHEKYVHRYAKVTLHNHLH